MRMKKEFCAYYRVSTKKQSAEMKTQKTAVKNYLKAFWPPSKSYTEVESGRKSDRAELQKALAYCKENDATLIVAKLDRLSRDLEFIGWLQNTDIDFVCCDMPSATRETIGFMGVMARWEREQIAKRTKEALAEKKLSGVKLGANNPKVAEGLKKWRAERAEIRKEKREKLLKDRAEKKANKKKKIKKIKKIKTGPSAREIADSKVIPVIQFLRDSGKGYKAIARELDKAGTPTRQGGNWTHVAVIRIMKRNNIK